MTNTEPKTNSAKQEEADLFSSSELKVNSNNIIHNDQSTYLTNVQIEEPTQIHQVPVSSVIHFEPTPLVKRLLNIKEVLQHDSDNEEDEVKYSSSSISVQPSISTQTSFPIIENGHDSGIIDDFCEPLNINLDFDQNTQQFTLSYIF